MGKGVSGAYGLILAVVFCIHVLSDLINMLLSYQNKILLF